MPGFDGIVSAALSGLLGAFLGALLSRIMSVAIPILEAGDESGAESAQRIIGFLQALESNFALVALIGALMVLLARGVTKGGVGA